VSVAAVRSPAEFESVLQRYLFERSEEYRAVRVGEKETSEQAAIVARYGDLFSREQLGRLRQAEESFRGEEMPLRTAQARLAVLPEYRDRDELGDLHATRSAGFNPERLDLLRANHALESEYSGEADAIRRNEETKAISLEGLAEVLAAASEASTTAWQRLRATWFERLLGPDRDDEPASSHVSYLRRLSPLEPIYTKERSVDVCLATLAAMGFRLDEDPNIRLDLEDRPQKSPRACVIASDPPTVVHLITRSQGGLHDYSALLHEAGHALHYAGCDPSLPYTFRRISRDHALTEIYSYIVEAITREPGWHAEHFGLSDEEAATNAEATTFIEVLLFRRYTAKLHFELEFWRRFAEDGGSSDGYAERITRATGVRYRSDNYLSDMDAGFYSADYLRAWIRSAQLRASLIREVGEDWWRRPETGERLRALFAEGTKPTSEEIAGRLGFDPLDTGPLLEELG
jgi:hypothetical protein